MAVQFSLYYYQSRLNEIMRLLGSLTHDHTLTDTSSSQEYELRCDASEIHKQLRSCEEDINQLSPILQLYESQHDHLVGYLSGICLRSHNRRFQCPCHDCYSALKAASDTESRLNDLYHTHSTIQTVMNGYVQLLIVLSH